MTHNILAYNLIILFMTSLCFSSASYAKSRPTDFSELINNSHLIAMVNVVEIKSQGKSMPGFAAATIKQTLKGKSSKETINIHWQGMAITSLGQWLLFLTNDPDKGADHYNATYGARSFWKIEYAENKNNECCSPFVVLRQPVSMLKFENSLITKESVYITGMPHDLNPVAASGISINNLIRYINKEK